MDERCEICGKPISECGGIMRCRRYSCICSKHCLDCQFYRDDGLCYWWCTYRKEDDKNYPTESK
nr:MAG TPA: zinc-ribbon domain protein [Caudoviricetes sp.]